LAQKLIITSPNVRIYHPQGAW